MRQLQQPHCGCTVWQAGRPSTQANLVLDLLAGGRLLESRNQAHLCLCDCGSHARMVGPLPPCGRVCKDTPWDWSHGNTVGPMQSLLLGLCHSRGTRAPATRGPHRRRMRTVGATRCAMMTFALLRCMEMEGIHGSPLSHAGTIRPACTALSLHGRTSNRLTPHPAVDPHENCRPLTSKHVLPRIVPSELSSCTSTPSRDAFTPAPQCTTLSATV